MRTRVSEVTGDFPGDARVYLVHVGNFAPSHAEETVLSVGERRRADTFELAFVRKRFVWRRIILRTLIAARLGCRPHEVDLQSTPAGRPFVAGSDLDVSVSHSRDVALIAMIGGRKRIGVDVEALAPMPDQEQVAEIVLTPQELTEFRRFDVSCDVFYRIWTCKEACLKAIGTGFRLDPRAVEIRLADLAAPMVQRIPGSVRYTLTCFEPITGYIAALAVQLGEEHSEEIAR
ncbi:4'-phosphopantetheinyl transferase family protein [Blastochloris viridis]|uniref:Holo-(Acyl carrier protein) synthase 2 n=1 Tax=Blastochloris viridis TaxID=1079 RepID=A0A0P0JJI4_BLAVI|nr:4'-phosphopantetheinyl transferase superfamily protein [Blastochloris viridis]ALK10601.1 holo-(acyl carrier protein) synthase 2 [Blastochloris viridis]CUU43264.1 holo-(acyl carrier protein) synthase 2 [Blastochloris viridis]